MYKKFLSSVHLRRFVEIGVGYKMKAYNLNKQFPWIYKTSYLIDQNIIRWIALRVANAMT